MSTWKEKKRLAENKTSADKTKKEKVSQSIKPREEEGSNN